MNKPYYADLHHHPGTRNYNKNERRKYKTTAEYNPWHLSKPEREIAKNRGKRAMGYAQSDVSKLNDKNVKISVFSLYPMEMGFSKIVIAILQQLFKSILTEYPLKRLNYLSSVSYDYFIELLTEYHYYTNQDRTTNQDSFGNSGAYRIVKDRNDLIAGMASDEILLIPTIEGMHGLGLGQVPYGGTDLSKAELLKRIDFLRGKNELEDLDIKLTTEDKKHFAKKWLHCPFFITFAHHFDNTLCGHARSLPLQNTGLFKQNSKLNVNMNALGMEICRNLLGIDKDGIPTGERRILIDIRHMSPLARKDYYEIVEEHNSKNGVEKIPIIMSHSGYSGIRTINDQVSAELEYAGERRKWEKKKFNKKLYKRYGFYWWAINLTDEDIIAIVRSGGLIGISMDERILGREAIVARKKDPQNSTPINLSIQMEKIGRQQKLQNMRMQSIQIFARTVEAMVKAVFAHDENGWDNTQKLKVWDCLTIGSDYDGFIDPLDGFATCEYFGAFEVLLVSQLEKIEKVNPFYFKDITPLEAARKICYGNVEGFCINHYPNK